MREQILADLRAGMPQRTVAKKHDVTRYAVQQLAAAAGLAKSDGRSKDKGRRRCTPCGKDTWSRTSVCQKCTAAENGGETYTRGLTGGRWVRRGLIQIWEKEAA